MKAAKTPQYLPFRIAVLPAEMRPFGLPLDLRTRARLLSLPRRIPGYRRQKEWLREWRRAFPITGPSGELGLQFTGSDASRGVDGTVKFTVYENGNWTLSANADNSNIIG
ncbi:hypothetical protein [Actinomadura livida]|uniref:Uncharacterized protein n=1 Tax=Actinomadura livida TaxID=79909 RepID=A0A7W7IHG5_9ACTN|nr:MULTISPECIES: hypothetical protein [Actinomadura]MBB4777192.1 hypothetical protein [Actinomadura catellatispora]GGU20993.1 hypothetical protein GCM10010208_52540 [Actinomadura livida]